MKVLITGKGTSGSWQIRGIQLGKALGARVAPMVAAGDADIVVGVKRLPDTLLAGLRGRPLVWDVVDAWPQPAGNEWSVKACRRWLEQEVARIKPAAFIAATAWMAKDLEVFGRPVLYLPHHHRPRIAINPIREHVRLVGYEGAVDYVKPWQHAIESACRRIGALFVINPPALADVDIVLALRGAIGYAPRHWKSGVKLANAHGSGTPWIGGRESGYQEISQGAEYWADFPSELDTALEWLLPQSTRQAVSQRFLSSAFPVEEAAKQLHGFLCKLRS
jgi:hypothetical protein